MVPFYSFDSLKKYPMLIHRITTKSDEYPYSFSLALHTGEREEEIIRNRDTLVSLLSPDKKLTFVAARQTHSDHIEIIESAEIRGWGSLEDAVEACDALITAEKNVILTILTADCVPILLYDPVREVVAAVHAGWKGSKAEIVKKTVQRMHERFDSNAEDIVAAVAPSIGACCYEVGEEVAKYFFELPDVYTQKGDKYMLNLPYINKYQLLDAGLKERNIEMSNICTACETDRFFSYRKEQGCSGRFMSLIGLRMVD